MNTGQWIRDAGSAVALATIVVIGVLAIGTAPVAATGNHATIVQEFGFGDDDDDGPGFGFEDNDDGPDFDFGGDDDSEDPGFGGDDDSEDPGFGGDDDSEDPGFGGDDDSEDPGFGGDDDSEDPGFGGDDDSEDPGFGGDDDSEDPGFDFGDDDDSDSGDGNESDGGTDPAAPADFQLSGVSTSGVVTAGDTLDVTATVENVGDSEDTQTVSLSVAGAERGSQSVTLASGASQTVTLSWQTAAGDAGEYTATVSSANDTATTGVTVDAQPDPANFAVSNVQSNSPVTEGETLTVDATVENTGDQQGTQTVTLSVLGASDDQQVTLASGASQTVTLSVATQTGDAGQYSASVTTANDTVSTSARVDAQPDPATLAVSAVSSNAPVTAGDTLDVTATVENTGDQQGTQTVALSVGGTERDSQSVTLASGASQTITLSWQTAAGDAGSYTATAATANDSAQTDVTVTEQPTAATFAVSAVSSNSPVTAGDTLDVTATVTNTGDQQGTQTVSLGVNGAIEDSQQLTLAGGASQTITLSWQTAAGETGTVQTSVASANDTASTTVTVEAQPDPASFTLSGVSSNSPVTAGDTVEVTATVENTGDLEGTQTIQLTDGSAVLDSQEVTLASGASQQVTLSWQTTADDVGDNSLTVRSDDDTATASVSVTEQPNPANFAVSQASAPGSVTAGDTVEVTTTVTNTGDQQGTQTVYLTVGGTVDRRVDTQSVTLAGGASQQVTLSWQTQAGQTGDFGLFVGSANDSARTNVSVVAQPDPANFQVSNLQTNTPVTAGDTLDATATVTNTGDLDGTQTVSLGVNGAVEDSQQVTLASGASQTITLSWQTTAGETGTVQTSVASANDTASTDVTVEAQPDPATFQVSNLQTNTPVTAGDALNATVTVTNTGDQEGTQTVRLGIRSGTASDSQEDSQQLTLAGGESQTITLSWATAAGDAGNYTAGVFTLDDSAQAGVTIEEQPDPATFRVENISSNSPVTVGETLDVTATITNTGDLEGTQTVQLGVARQLPDSQQVTLAGGESTTVTLSWQPTASDAGTYDARIASTDFARDTSVTIEALEPANFTISGASSTTPVTEGETVSVDALVGNFGERPGTQTVTLSVAGSQVDSQQLSLNASESRDVTLTWQTQLGDAGSYTPTVATANASFDTSVTVTEQPDPANFTITGTSSDSPVTEDETLTVDATVRNDGDRQGSQTVDLTVANTVRASRSVQLASGASTTVSLSWTTQSGDAGDYTATVETANDSATTPVTVESATIQPTGFTGVAEDGYVEINGSSGQRFGLQPCPNGQPLNDTYECLSVDATVDGDSWSAAPSDVTFPNQSAEGPLGGQLTIVVNTPNGLSGTIDPETGRATVNGTLQIRVPDLRAGCGTSFVVNATTGASGGLTGTPLSVNGTTARATIVDGLFSVPAASGCGAFLNGQLNNQVGIPSASGQNELSLDLYLDLQEAS